ncbi:MAG: HIT family protein [Spirochaetia bacterium]|jgi:histidine triad (HIT) family protein|nr:HIT family protein [Spirochaetia bacterium]
MDTVFDKIIKGEIPSVKIHEDESCVVIMDINPVVKGHCLVISRISYPNFTDCPTAQLSHMMEIAKSVDKKLRKTTGCEGTNIVINNGAAAGQAIPHLHIHVIPRFSAGTKITFPHESYKDNNEMQKLGAQLKF